MFFIIKDLFNNKKVSIIMTKDNDCWTETKSIKENSTKLYENIHELLYKKKK